MIVSDTHRFICFQPWKTASSTLFRPIEKYDSGRYPQPVYLNEILRKQSHKHIPYEDFLLLPEAQGD